ncbi:MULTISPECIES: phosphoribosylanthranilate isomerase [Acidithrix]|uniref:N-(5'-phosphoribosyl)anthranilate isomerase n=1 Tax=Acidithrix ferrooxidans TaxID=1280514 RepID=A0A0D8HGU4_9ACTN|nr:MULTISPECIES: phosphoribosylanthranilate isomerase [Acidithrix]KJF17069.1 N-(5'-phosphoribosyl)anthranilate isomerase [Acidithrix ferrooxidans]CAG4923146.1 unnamed protein product [Acidithrix sp. C25]
MFIKICGITNEEDALLAVALGADALGFIFAPSPRMVSVNVARDIIKRLPSEILTIGVFVNEDPDELVRIVHSVGLGGAQLHGNESVETVLSLRLRLNYLIKALPADGMSIRSFFRYPVDALLVDSAQPGSGKAFDWSIIEAEHMPKRIILAGGLNSENVREAITTVRPYGVDVSSGVESAPGKKDPVALRAFISNAKSAFVTLDRDPLGDSISATSSSPIFNWEEHL